MVPLRKDGMPCLLREHFIAETALREVIAFLDFLASLDKTGERFIYCKLYSELLKNCHDKAGNGFSLRLIEMCVRFLRECNILVPAVRRRFGRDWDGWIVASHDAVTTTASGYCILRSTVENPACGSVNGSVNGSVGGSVAFGNFTPVVRSDKGLDGLHLESKTSGEKLKKQGDNPITPLSPLSPEELKHDTAIPENREDSRNVFLNSSPPDERNPIDVLTTAARALTVEYGDIGTNLAAYIAAHCLNGTGMFPETTSYYMTSAERCYTDDSGGWVAENGYDGRIYDFMLEDAPERLRRAIQNNTSKDADSILRALDEQRKRMGVPDEDAA